MRYFFIFFLVNCVLLKELPFLEHMVMVIIIVFEGLCIVYFLNCSTTYIGYSFIRGKVRGRNSNYHTRYNVRGRFNRGTHRSGVYCSLYIQLHKQ